MTYRVLIACSTFFAWQAIAQASCAPTQPAYVAFRDSDFVFTGRVLSVTKSEGYGPWVYNLEVNQVWKGQLGEEVKIYSFPPGCASGYDFKVGQSYFVYANLEEGRLRVNACSRTMPQDEAKDDIQTADRILEDAESRKRVQPPAGHQNPWFVYAIGLVTGIGCTCAVILLRRLRTVIG